MKKTITAALTALVFCSISTANAESYKNTVSVGYAHAAMSGFISDNAPGINVKYHWEDLKSGVGAIVSTSYNATDVLNGLITVKQTTLLAGPSYRFNDYINVYAMAGIANGRAETTFGDDNQSKFTYGLGFQVNPANNWAIDASYQYARFDIADEYHIDAGTWVLGVGYSF